MVYGIASEDELDHVLAFRDQMQITFPILFDADGAVHEQYVLQNEIAASYPEDWIIGADGRVAYVNNAFDVDAMIEVIEAELR